METRIIELSDHGIARYVERVMKIDNEDMLCLLFNERTISMISLMGAGKYPTKDGHTAVVVDNEGKLIIVTLI